MTVIFGDLIADGDLMADTLFCHGNIRVAGNLKVKRLYLAGSMDVGGDFLAEYVDINPVYYEVYEACGELEAAFEMLDTVYICNIACESKLPRFFADPVAYDAESPAMYRRHPQYEIQMVKNLKLNTSDLEGVDKLIERFIKICQDKPIVDDLTYSELEGYELEGFVSTVAGSFDVTSSRNCTEVHGTLIVKGEFKCHDFFNDHELIFQSGNILGNMHSHGYIDCQKDCRVSGDIFAPSIKVGGSLTVVGECHGDAVGITVGGDIKAHSIFTAEHLFVGGFIETFLNIEAEKYIKAGKHIYTFAGHILSGEDYGVFAGLDVPRAKWESEGYILARNIPAHILSGVNIADLPFPEMDDE